MIFRRLPLTVYHTPFPFSSMDSLKSFKGYGKVDPVEDTVFRRKTRKRLIVLSVSIFILIVLVIGAAVGVALRHRSGDDDNDAGSPSSSSLSNAIKLVCSLTLHPDTCFASLSSSAAANSTDPQDLFSLSLRVAIAGLRGVADLPQKLSATVNDTRLKEALQICSEQIQDSIDILNNTLTSVKKGEKVLKQNKVDELRTLLSAVLADLDTCYEGFEGTTGGFREKLEAALKNSTEFASNSLAIVTHIFSLLGNSHRKLLAEPEWVSKSMRVLLQDTVNFDVTVAQDGTGDVETIGEALARVPKNNPKAFVIKVKAGKYDELVMVQKYMWNVVMIGDGAGQSIITGSRSAADGTRTFNTASFVVEGKGFMAQGMTFENTAGSKGSQAVAARIKADQVVFYQCSFLAFQDTLYAHSFRQFYSNCDIVGTVDFIFGDAKAVFQNCSLMPRQPGPGQQNMITAQGRSDPNENTGFSIQSCKVAAFDSVSMPTFLGRPWRNYSTAVFMTTDIGNVVDPRGWRSWDGVSMAPPSTTFYAEYMNTGTGASTAGRTKWAGYKEALTMEEAQMYSVGSFIQGDQWLPSSVAYKLSL